MITFNEMLYYTCIHVKTLGIFILFTDSFRSDQLVADVGCGWERERIEEARYGSEETRTRRC